MLNSDPILLVDDSEDDVFIMTNAFKRVGVVNPTFVVSDGEAAIAYLKGESPFDRREEFPLPVMVFLDVSMPKRNGLEVLKWIREQPGFKKLTVHMLSASSRPADVVEAALLHANTYLIKPTRIEEMFDMIKSWYSLSHFAAHSAI